MQRLSALLIGIWLGLHIGIGYIAAPTLFARLSSLPDGRAIAGDIAGSLFHWVNYVGLVAWILVWWIAKREARLSYRKTRAPMMATCVVVLTAINEFAFSPVIHALRQQHTHWLHNLIGGDRGMWHGISSIIYIIIGLIGLGLCIRLLRLDTLRR